LIFWQGSVRINPTAPAAICKRQITC